MNEPGKYFEKIKIYSVKVKKGGKDGGKKDEHELLNCYFQMYDEPGNYRFYSHSREHIRTAPAYVTSETTTFQFIYGGTLWTVDEFYLDNSLPISKAHGHWSNGRRPEDDNGEFQAQAGGGADETASAATA